MREKKKTKIVPRSVKNDRRNSGGTLRQKGKRRKRRRKKREEREEMQERSWKIMEHYGTSCIIMELRTEN